MQQISRKQNHRICCLIVGYDRWKCVKDNSRYWSKNWLDMVHLSRLGTQKEQKGQFQNNNIVTIINNNDDDNQLLNPVWQKLC